MHPATDPGDDRNQVSRPNGRVEVGWAPVDVEVTAGGVHLGRLEQRSQCYPGRHRHAPNGTSEDDDAGGGLVLSHRTLRPPSARAG